MTWNVALAATAVQSLSSAASTANLLVSHFSGGVYTLGYNGSALTQISRTTGCGGQPSWITLDSAGGNLFCFDESGGWANSGGGVVSEYTVGTTGQNTLLASPKNTGGTVHGWLYGGTTGRGFLALANYGISSLTTFKLPLASSSTILQTIALTLPAKGTIPSRQDAAHPHSSLTDPTGKFLVVPDLGSDLLRVYSIDANSGQLTACSTAAAVPGDGPRHAAFWANSSTSANAQMLYAVNELSNTISAWKVTNPASTGGCLTLARTQSISTFAPGTVAPANSSTNPSLPSKAAEVHIYGNFLYASNRNDQIFGSQQDSLAVYTINATTGALTFLQAAQAYAWYPRSFAINKAGTLLAVGGQTTSNVVILPRNTTTGLLGPKIASINVASQGTNGGENGLSGVLWDE